MDNKLYFTCNYPSKGTELCVYDGTTVSLAADIDSGSESSSPSYLTVNGSTLYFRASTDENGYELWKYTNGTASLVGDIYPGNNEHGYINSSSPSSLTSVGDRVYFRATNSTTGNELYYADSTGTHLAVDVVAGENGSSLNNLIAYNNKLYFTASLDDKGYELFVYNVDGSYSLVEDIYEGTSSSSPSYLQVFNGKLIFRANTATTGTELFEYDGSDVTLVQDLDPTIDGNGNARSSYPSNLNILGDKLFFTASSLAKGSELYIYDGTAISSIGDLNPKTSSYNFSNFASYKNKLYFRGSTDNNGSELWMHDLVNDPALALDVRSGYSSSSPYYLTEFLNRLYFRASTDENGTELVAYDGNSYEIIDLQPGSGSSSPSSIIAYKKELLFLASGPDGYGAHKYNGFSTPTKLQGDFTGFSYPSVCNNTLYFQASGTDGSGSELWSYDGNITKMVSDIHESGSSSPMYLTCVNNKLYFAANHPTHGSRELWVLDGNETQLAFDAYTGTDYRDNPRNSYIERLTAVGDTLYFYARNDVNGTELYSYDGTNATMYDSALGKTYLSSGDIFSFDSNLYRELRDSSNKYNLTMFPDDTAIGDQSFNSMSNFTIVQPQPNIGFTNNVVVNEDNASFEVVFNGFGDPDNRDLNITLETNGTALLDINTSWISGVKTYSEYSGKEIRIVVTPKPNLHGEAAIYVTVNNGLETITEAMFITVLSVDDEPTFTLDPSDVNYVTGTSDVNQTILVEDIDQDNIVYTVTSADTSIVTVAIVGNKVIFTPVSQVVGQTTTIDVNATANGVTIGKTITYTVIPPNNIPSIDTTFTNIVIDEDNGTINYELNVSDADGDELNVTVESNNTNILTVSPSWSGLLNQAGYSQTLDFNTTTVQNAYGTVRVTIKANDGRANSTTSFDINVSSVDDIPVLVSIPTTVNDEDNASTKINLSPLVSDADNNSSQTVFAVSSSNDAIADVKIVNGILIIIPQANANGSVNIELNATLNGQTVTKTFTYILNPVNDAPKIRNISDITLEQSTSIQSDDISFNIADENLSLLLSISNTNGELFNDINVTNNEDGTGTLKYSIVQNGTGISKVTITANDGELSFKEYLNISVKPANDALCVEDSKTALTFDTIKNNNPSQNYIKTELSFVSSLPNVCNSSIS